MADCRADAGETGRMWRAAELLDGCAHKTLVHHAFPWEHCRLIIRANNLLERLLREIWRRTKVVGAFADGVRRHSIW